MAQQINLHTPILLQPVRVFSARTMATALGVLALGLLGLTGVLLGHQHRAAQEAQATAARQQLELTQLRAALAEAERTADPQALRQELARLQEAERQWHQARQVNLHEMLPAGQGHAELLAWTARELPPAVWLRQLQLAPDEVLLEGATLDTLSLQRWLARLASRGDLHSTPWRELTVQQVPPAGTSRGPEGSSPPLSTGGLPPGSWAFRLRAARHTPPEHAPPPAAAPGGSP
ncbi:hypothetical protein [Ideonella livida]|uniref:PilN domain-containing protein n=1 Tax=Ideonella livida TaxID=2707176 RepID=A0A7C9PF63_9BURK|nr:hypothetical protein [Ideonella livida]NDY89872.1 hypothetical protein [Ideonella livida]